MSIEAAIDLALIAHRGQIDKGGHPYILHPIRVMLKGVDYNEMVVGVLHDVVEDSSIGLGTIKTLFGDVIARAVDAITHREHEPNKKYIERVVANPIAAAVKVNDILDNSDPRRMRVLDATTAARIDKKHTMMLNRLREAGYL